MVPINLHQPGRLNVFIQFPERWEELFPAEVLAIAKHLLHPATARQAILFHLIESRARMQKITLPPDWKNILDTEQAFTQGLPLLDFIYKANDLVVVPEPTIRFPTLLFPDKLFGPADAFENITCGEFEDGEQHYLTFTEAPEPAPLANMAAILWRPKGTPYIRYQHGHYHTYHPGLRLKQIQKLAPHRLFAIYLWYTGCRNLLPRLFPTVYESGGEKNKVENEPPDLMAFTRCIHSAAGQKNGSRGQIRMTKLLEFMFDMEQEAIKAKDLKAQYEQR